MSSDRHIGRYGPWEVIDKSVTTLIDGGGVDARTLYLHPRSVTGPAGIQLNYLHYHNRSGSSANVGVGVRIAKNAWSAGQWTNATTTFADDTTDAQSTATGDFPLEVASTNNDGFIVSSLTLFSALSILVSVASTGSPVRTVEYSTGASTWSAMTNILFAGASANFGVGENLIWWIPPSDWTPMTASHGTGVNVGEYGIRMRATTAPTVAAVATSISIHRIYFMFGGVANSGIYELRASGDPFTFDPHGDALVFCTNFPSAVSRITAQVRTQG